MAATLTADQELLYFSIPVEKTEDTPEGDVLVYGKCTDGSLDRDLQVVDPEWSQKALSDWLDTGGNVRMSHDARKPVGKGLNLDFSADGAYLRALVVDPVAKDLVRKGVLTAYSVGISRPQIDPDPVGKAVNGIIRGNDLTEICEVSLVDRPANRNCGIALVRKGADGTAEFAGEVFGEYPGQDADLIKASIAFKPSDLARLLEHRRVAEERLTGKASAGADEQGAGNAADDEKDEPSGEDDTGDDGDEAADKAVAGVLVTEPEMAKREIGTEARERLASEHNALPDGSYPIENTEDLKNAAILARSGHGDATAARRLIARRARELGVGNPLADGSAKAAGAGPAKKACECGKRVKATAKFCRSCGAKFATPDEVKSPSPGDGVTGEHTGPVPAHREPDGAAMELLERDAGLADGDEGTELAASARTEPPALVDSEKALATGLRHKAAGADFADGWLHDLLCPAYSADETAKCYADASPGSAASPEQWQARALDAAAKATLEDAGKAMARWQDAITIKATDETVLAGLRDEAHKAFRDANPGPGSFPTPAENSAQRFRRPLITAGHEASSPGHDGPNTAAVPSGQTSAAQYGRGPLTDGHAAPAPENSGGREGAVAAPAAPGRPQRAFYRNSMRDNARQAMAAMHDHIAQSFPDLCPVHGPGSDGTPPVHQRPVPTPQGTPAASPVSKTAGTAKPKKPCPACGKPGKGPFCKSCGKPMAPKADKQALTETTEAARAQFAQVQAELGPNPWGLPDAEAIKAALAEALAPLQAQLAGQQKLIDEMAAEPDPRYAPFKAVASGGVPPRALQRAEPTLDEAAEHAKSAMVRELEVQWRTSPDPAQREAAWNALLKARGVSDLLTKQAGPVPIR